jgi:hypothetical protein
MLRTKKGRILQKFERKTIWVLSGIGLDQALTNYPL